MLQIKQECLQLVDKQTQYDQEKKSVNVKINKCKYPTQITKIKKKEE